MDKNEVIFYTLLSGPALMAWGFGCFRKKRHIENIPTSKIRSAAMGIVELCGKTLVRGRVISPYSGNVCCYWQYQIQKYVGGKRSRWETVKTISSPDPFYLKDETGQVMVDPTNAEFMINASILSLDTSSKMVKDMLAGWGISSGLFGLGTYRLIETIIYPDSNLYVIGEIGKYEQYFHERNNRYRQLVLNAKKDPALMASADTNNDGIVDTQEWEALERRLEQEFIAAETNRQGTLQADDRIVVKAPVNNFYLITNESERSLVSALYWKSWLGLAGGLAVTSIGLILAESSRYSLHSILMMLAGGAAAGIFFNGFLRRLFISHVSVWRRF